MTAWAAGGAGRTSPLNMQQAIFTLYTFDRKTWQTERDSLDMIFPFLIHSE
jgi:hypothetical protein